MKNKITIFITLALFVVLTNTVNAQDEDKKMLTTESGLGIQFGGEVELEFVDVEGEGGFSNQDLTLKKIDTRSPYMQIDKAVFSTKVFYHENLTYEIQFRFNDKKAFVDKHYATLKIPSIGTKFEIGKNRPMIKTSRYTEGYPLIGTAFWKGREYHIASKTNIAVTDNIKLGGGLSFAMKRPLGTDDAAEDKSFKMIVYDDYANKDGQTFEYGINLAVEMFGFTGQGWFYTGELIDDWDWKTSLSAELNGYDNLGDRTDRTHYWYGGRGTFDRWNLHLRGEFIGSQDGLLPRDGYYGEASYTLDVSKYVPIKSIAPFVRYGELNVRDIPEVGGSTESWDRKMTTLALLTSINPYLDMKMEYYLLDEVTGGTGDDEKKKDNHLLVQFNFKF